LGFPLTPGGNGLPRTAMLFICTLAVISLLFVGDDAGNALHRAQGGGAAGRDDLHVLQMARLQAGHAARQKCEQRRELINVLGPFIATNIKRLIDEAKKLGDTELLFALRSSLMKSRTRFTELIGCGYEAPAHWLDGGDRHPAVVADTFAFSLEGSRVRGNVGQ